MKIATHIDKKKTSYNYDFKQEKLFCENFIDRVSWRLHRLFDSFSSGDTSNIDIGKLDFSDMVEQVERLEYHSKLPSWIHKLMKKNEENKKTLTAKTDVTVDEVTAAAVTTAVIEVRDANLVKIIRVNHVQNTNSQYGCMLVLTKQFRDVFHPGVMRNLDKPKKKNGIMMCLRFHTLGFYFGDCK